MLQTARSKQVVFANNTRVRYGGRMDHPVKIGQEAAGRLKFANVFSPALETIAAFFDDLGVTHNRPGCDQIPYRSEMTPMNQ
jgi:hypothetical protein